MTRITTLAANVIVTDDTRKGIDKIVAGLARDAKTMEKVFSSPIGEAERKINALIPVVDRLMGKSNISFLSDREIQKLEQAAKTLQQIWSTVNLQGGASHSGFTGLSNAVGILNQGISSAQRLGMRNPEPSMFQQIRDFEYMGAMTRPASIFNRQDDPMRGARIERNRMLHDRDAYESWWSQQQIGPTTTRRFVPNQNFGLPDSFGPIQFARGFSDEDRFRARLMKADERNRGYGSSNAGLSYGNDSELDLDRYLNNRQNVVRRNAGLIINRYQRETGTLPPEEQAENRRLNGLQAQGMTIGSSRNRFSQIAGHERAAGMDRQAAAFEPILRAEEQTVTRLTERWSKLTDEQRKNVNFRIQARTQAGFDTTLQQRAMGNVTDPTSPFNQKRGFGSGRGSYSHALQFGTQNLAFGLEDFLISSQYGGPKAGFRAITNNMTAIAAAATGSLNPWLGAGIIGSVAVGGALAPSIYGALSGDDERGTELSNQLASPRAGTMAAFDRQIRSRQAVGSGVNSARQQYQDSIDAVNRFTQQRQDIVRGIGSRTNRIGSETVGWGETFGSAVQSGGRAISSGLLGQWISGLGREGGLLANTAGLFDNNNARTTNFRPFAELREIGKARQLRDAANANIKGLGDPEILRQNQIAAQQSYEQERQFLSADRMVTNRANPMLSSISARQMRGELVSPSEQYEIEKGQRFVQLGQLRQTYKNQPNRVKDMEQEILQEQTLAENRHGLDMEQFNLSVRDRNWRHRSTLNDFETNPHKKLEEQADIQREMILADQQYTPDQQRLQVAGLEKLHQFSLRDLNWKHRSTLNNYETNPYKKLTEQTDIQREMILADQQYTPDQQRLQVAGLEKLLKKQLSALDDYAGVGSAIDAGSASDVRLRQKYFDRSGGTEGQTDDSRKLGEIVTEIRGLREDIKKAQPRTATIKGK